MKKIKISGGKPLQGTVNIRGAKNAVTKILVASLLSDKKCILTNVPNIDEVATTLELCKEVGMEVSWDKENGIIEAETKELNSVYIHQRFSGANRIPILMIGALLGRTTEDIIVPTTGGCKIGKRPVDFHIIALEKLGATIEYRQMRKEGAYFAHAHNGLKGAIIELPYPSVGATENSILAACRAKGHTVIKNAALEPEVIDLVLFLQKLGVNIHIDVNREIHIYETKTFYEVTHHIIPDRIEAASYGMAGVITKGRVFVKGACQEHLITFLHTLRKIGGGFDIKRDGIEFFYEKPLVGGLHLETDVHPGFLTDWQQPFVVLLSQAEGISIVHETVYENRFGYTKDLIKMGAEIELFTKCLGTKPCRFQHQSHKHSLIIKGPTPLIPGDIVVPDLRAGFAYVIAALVADGESTISGLPFLDRGYEEFDKKLAILGADIQRDSKTKQLENLLSKKPMKVS